MPMGDVFGFFFLAFFLPVNLVVTVIAATHVVAVSVVDVDIVVAVDVRVVLLYFNVPSWKKKSLAMFHACKSSKNRANWKKLYKFHKLEKIC